MIPMLTLKDISAEKIRDGGLREELPELYKLQEVVQQNHWHKGTTVFAHSLAVMKRVQEITEQLPQHFIGQMGESLGNYSWDDILKLAALLHDIGKPESFAPFGDETKFPGHEAIGAEKAGSIISRFGLNGQEEEIVVELIRRHGDIHLIMSPENLSREQQLAALREQSPHMGLCLLLIGLADTLGSDLETLHPEEFRSRIAFYRQELGLP
ncbi:HD domain-containing protein [Candidatus Woesearchaeota archaeon]|nr:HD domain-containing protein [Candidatus Woesearchaeota archaeon]